MTIRENDLGLGTIYERFALYDWLEILLKKYEINSVLEGPGDGLTGIPGLNSLVFGREGVHTIVALGSSRAVSLARRGWRTNAPGANVDFVLTANGRLPFKAESFDLVWNFNRLPFFPLKELLSEMGAVSKNLVLIFVPNRRNYGYWLRRLHHRKTGRPWIYGNIEDWNLRNVIAVVEDQNLKVLETCYIDAPWWPDIIDIRQFMIDFIPLLDGLIPARNQENNRWQPENLPYFDIKKFQEVHHRIDRLSFIERMRSTTIKRIFAHHLGILAYKR